MTLSGVLRYDKCPIFSTLAWLIFLEAGHCKLLTDKAYYGRCASKRSWFYGLKVQAVAGRDDLPVKFYTHTGAESEQTGQRGLALDLPKGSVLCTDAGYTDYVAEDLFNEASGSQQQTARHQNSKRPQHPA